MGRGEKAKRLFPLSPFPSHHSLLALYARSHHSSLALLACFACSRVPQSPLSLRKTCGGGSRLGNVSFSGLVNRLRGSRSQRLLPRLKTFPKNVYGSFPQAV